VADARPGDYLVKKFTSSHALVKHIAESTVRRLSLYLGFLETFESRGLQTISSDELARQGGTTSAQVRKDLSFFGSFGKRGLGYSVAELSARLRSILGLGREWRVIIVGAGKIGAALAQYRGFAERGFRIVGVYDKNPALVGTRWDDYEVRDIAELEADVEREKPEIAVLAVSSEGAQEVVDRLARAGIRAVLNFAAVPLTIPSGLAIKTVNMAMELEGLSFALTNRE
jgi:redox-sensing transcriptional repressor